MAARHDGETSPRSPTSARDDRRLGLSGRAAPTSVPTIAAALLERSEPHDGNTATATGARGGASRAALVRGGVIIEERFHYAGRAVIGGS